MRILIIEDNPTIVANLCDFLAARGHSVNTAGDGIFGLHLALTQQFDAIVLDIGLPGLNGFKLCNKLRTDGHIDTPVLMLTARDGLQDKLRGFESGANDYLVKPFALREVEERLIGLHKGSSGRVTATALVVGALSFDPRSRSVRFADNEVKLRPKCIKLLEMMMKKPGCVFGRAELERAVWGDVQETGDTLRNHMHLLRQALTDAGGRDPIECVHGHGYRLFTAARHQI